MLMLIINLVINEISNVRVEVFQFYCSIAHLKLDDIVRFKASRKLAEGQRNLVNGKSALNNLRGEIISS